MQNSARLCLLSLTVLIVPFAGMAAGQPPDLFRQYRFLPDHSTLRVSGGFAGWDFRSPVTGTFGLVTGFQQGIGENGFPTLDPYASFIDVDAYWIHPLILAPSPLDRIDLDETLNLSGLDGRPIPLPIAAPIDIELFKFAGRDGQGAPFRLHALRYEDWLFMRGSNKAPCCDFFDYEFKSLSREIPFADFNNDAAVDNADLDILEARFGARVTPMAEGDLDGDGFVGGSEFLNWQRSYGETMPAIDFDGLLDTLLAASGGPSAAVTSVPEPGTLAGAIVVLLSLTGVRRRAVSHN